MKIRTDIIIGIDPDCKKSGVAELETSTKRITLYCMEFPNLMDYLLLKKKESEEKGYKLVVVVEAGWLNQSNWHLKSHDNARIAAAKGNATGRNHEVARKIVEMSKHYGLRTKEVKPLVKCWSGPDGKITRDELAEFIPNLPVRTTQETRDSALISWNEAGFPIKINSRK